MFLNMQIYGKGFVPTFFQYVFNGPYLHKIGQILQLDNEILKIIVISSGGIQIF